MDNTPLCKGATDFCRQPILKKVSSFQLPPYVSQIKSTKILQRLLRFDLYYISLTTISKLKYTNSQESTIGASQLLLK